MGLWGDLGGCEGIEMDGMVRAGRTGGCGGGGGGGDGDGDDLTSSPVSMDESGWGNCWTAVVSCDVAST